MESKQIPGHHYAPEGTMAIIKASVPLGVLIHGLRVLNFTFPLDFSLLTPVHHHREFRLARQRRCFSPPPGYQSSISRCQFFLLSVRIPR